ncbi:hypothetical protein ColLi_11478 [Colletotrichum liriopes]|uniref:Uncharacterized protein n=1 Tax=Colletotrichum liriopes TaxID=708192 RepID=A0AA37GWJ7_9PEZI|nr:hypothetical protein ColLi_11478 [Colletotrichum liriopes]
MEDCFIYTVNKSKGTSVTLDTPEQAGSRRPSIEKSVLGSNNNILPQSPQDLGVVDPTTVATANTIPTPPYTLSTSQSIAENAIDDEAWVASTKMPAAFTIIAQSSSDFHLGGGYPNWLLIDLLTTERRMRLDDANFADASTSRRLPAFLA